MKKKRKYIPSVFHSQFRNSVTKHLSDCLIPKTEQTSFIEDYTALGHSLYSKTVDLERFKDKMIHTDKLLQQQKKTRKLLLQRIGKIAAIVVVLIGCSLIFLKHNDPIQRNIAASEHLISLTLANGKEIAFFDTLSSIDLSKGVSLANDSLQIGKEKNKTFSKSYRNKEEYNTFKVGKGKTCQIILNDSTSVWMNSSSSLRYPTIFNGTERVVYLEGEAFFKVTPNAQKPFIVKTQNMDITVLGTSFNVSSYKEDRRIVTTLVEGKLKIADCKTKKSVTLLPNEQGVYDKGYRILSHVLVDASLYALWKDGYLGFQNETLENVTSKLERIYGIRISFEDNGLRYLHVTGKLPINKDYTIPLQAIGGLTDISLQIKEGNKEIIITKK